jgi:branched-chain amino acid transport system permease protein
MLTGAFVCYMAVVWWGLDYWLAFLIAVLTIAVFGALPTRSCCAGSSASRVCRRHADDRSRCRLPHLRQRYLGVRDLYPADAVRRRDQIAGVTLSHQYLSIIVGTLILCTVLYGFFNHTRIGVAMQATSQNQLAAYYMGIPVKRIFSMIWAISAGVATAAGVLLAPVTLIDINMGLAVALKAFAAAVLGGFGSIPGALVGGIVIGLIELYAGATLPNGFKDTAPYIVLLIMLAVRPQGLFGTLGRKKV